jgi:hypothetical protein
MAGSEFNPPFSNIFPEDQKMSGDEKIRQEVLQRFFLSRLKRMIGRRDDVGVTTNHAFVSNLLSRVIYSTFRDCLELGVGNEARQILKKEGRIEPPNQ